MTYIILFLSVISLFLGIIVLTTSLRKKEHIMFFLFAVVTSLWLFNNFLFRSDPTTSLSRLAYGIGILVASSGLIWVYSFIREDTPKFVQFFLYPFSLLVFLMVSFSGNIIVATHSTTLLGYRAEAGRLFPLFSLYMGVVIGLAIYKLIEGFRHQEDTVRKSQILYVLIGSILFGGIALTVSFIVPTIFNTFNFVVLDNFSTTFFLFFVVLAIARYQLFGIRIVLTQLLVGGFVFLLLMQIFLSHVSFGYAWHGSLFAIFLFIGYLLIKELFKEIKDKKRIEELSKKLVETEKKLAEDHRYVAAEVTKRLERTHSDLWRKDDEVDRLKFRIKELEEELEKRENRR